MANTIDEDLGNWSFHTMPDENTDVIVNSNGPHSNKLNSNGVCRSLTLSNGAVFTVGNGYSLDIKGK